MDECCVAHPSITLHFTSLLFSTLLFFLLLVSHLVLHYYCFLYDVRRVKLAAEAVDDADCARKREEEEVMKEAQAICRSFGADYVVDKSDGMDGGGGGGGDGLTSVPSPLPGGTEYHRDGNGVGDGDGDGRSGRKGKGECQGKDKKKSKEESRGQDTMKGKQKQKQENKKERKSKEQGKSNDYHRPAPYLSNDPKAVLMEVQDEEDILGLGSPSGDPSRTSDTLCGVTSTGDGEGGHRHEYRQMVEFSNERSSPINDLAEQSSVRIIRYDEKIMMMRQGSGMVKMEDMKVEEKVKEEVVKVEGTYPVSEKGSIILDGLQAFDDSLVDSDIEAQAEGECESEGEAEMEFDCVRSDVEAGKNRRGGYGRLSKGGTGQGSVRRRGESDLAMLPSPTANNSMQGHSMGSVGERVRDMKRDVVKVKEGLSIRSEGSVEKLKSDRGVLHMHNSNSSIKGDSNGRQRIAHDTSGVTIDLSTEDSPGMPQDDRKRGRERGKDSGQKHEKPSNKKKSCTSKQRKSDSWCDGASDGSDDAASTLKRKEVENESSGDDLFFSDRNRNRRLVLAKVTGKIKASKGSGSGSDRGSGRGGVLTGRTRHGDNDNSDSEQEEEGDEDEEDEEDEDGSSEFDDNSDNEESKNKKKKGPDKKSNGASKSIVTAWPINDRGKKSKQKSKGGEDGDDEEEEEEEEEFEVSEMKERKGTKKKGKPVVLKRKEVVEYRGLGKKILVFAHHQSVLNALEDFLRDNRVGFVRIDGTCPAAKRNALVLQFQDDDCTDVALLSVTACCVGINLTRANVALFAELHWSAGSVMQAEDRIHRIGQKATSVNITYMVAKGTADDIIWETIQRKCNVLGATVGISDNTGAGGMKCDKKNSSSSSKSHTTSSSNGSALMTQSVMDSYMSSSPPGSDSGRGTGTGGGSRTGTGAGEGALLGPNNPYHDSYNASGTARYSNRSNAASVYGRASNPPSSLSPSLSLPLSHSTPFSLPLSLPLSTQQSAQQLTVSAYSTIPALHPDSSSQRSDPRRTVESNPYANTFPSSAPAVSNDYPSSSSTASNIYPCSILSASANPNHPYHPPPAAAAAALVMSSAMPTINSPATVEPTGYRNKELGFRQPVPLPSHQSNPYASSTPVPAPTVPAHIVPYGALPQQPYQPQPYPPSSSLPSPSFPSSSSFISFSSSSSSSSSAASYSTYQQSTAHVPIQSMGLAQGQGQEYNSNNEHEKECFEVPSFGYRYGPANKKPPVSIAPPLLPVLAPVPISAPVPVSVPVSTATPSIHSIPLTNKEPAYCFYDSSQSQTQTQTQAGDSPQPPGGSIGIKPFSHSHANVHVQVPCHAYAAYQTGQHTYTMPSQQQKEQRQQQQQYGGTQPRAQAQANTQAHQPVQGQVQGHGHGQGQGQGQEPAGTTIGLNAATAHSAISGSCDTGTVTGGSYCWNSSGRTVDTHINNYSYNSSNSSSSRVGYSSNTVSAIDPTALPPDIQARVAANKRAAEARRAMAQQRALAVTGAPVIPPSFNNTVADDVHSTYAQSVPPPLQSDQHSIQLGPRDSEVTNAAPGTRTAAQFLPSPTTRLPHGNPVQVAATVSPLKDQDARQTNTYALAQVQVQAHAQIRSGSVMHRNSNNAHPHTSIPASTRTSEQTSQPYVQQGAVVSNVPGVIGHGQGQGQGQVQGQGAQHVFSTGKGGSVSVSAESVDRAGRFLNNPSLPTHSIPSFIPGKPSISGSPGVPATKFKSVHEPQRSTHSISVSRSQMQPAHVTTRDGSMSSDLGQGQGQGQAKPYGNSLTPHPQQVKRSAD